MKRLSSSTVALVAMTAMTSFAIAGEANRRVIAPVPFAHVQFKDTFWAPRLETNRKVTIPHNLSELKKQGSLGGFAILAGASQEKYHGYMWGDSDVPVAQTM